MDINTHDEEAVETQAYNSYLLVVSQKLCECGTLVNGVILTVAT